MVLGNLKNCVYPDYSHYAHSGDRDYHRKNRVADSSEQTSRNVHKSAEKIGDTDESHSYKTIAYIFRFSWNIDRKQGLTE